MYAPEGAFLLRVQLRLIKTRPIRPITVPTSLFHVSASRYRKKPAKRSATETIALCTIEPVFTCHPAIPENMMKRVMQRVKPDCAVIIDQMEKICPEVWDAWGFGQTESAAEEILLSDDPSGFILQSEDDRTGTGPSCGK